MTLEKYIQQKLKCFGLPPIIRSQLATYRRNYTDQQITQALIYSERKLGRKMESGGLPEIKDLPKEAYEKPETNERHKQELSAQPVIHIKERNKGIKLEDWLND